MSGSNAALSAQEIAASPGWYPLELSSPGLVRLARLDEAAYRDASFLDRRILQLQPEQAIVPAAMLGSAAAALAPQAHYIFHIGHVGSTLVSRLIGELPGFFSVREPALLREIALDPARERIWGALDLRDALGLLARRWRPVQRAVIKASSFVSEMAERSLELDATACAILMFTPALAYLCCIMGGPNSRLESQALGPSRLARLRKRLGGAADVDPRSEGEWIAMSWLCEMLCLQAAARRCASRVTWIDFDQFLAAPHEGLEAAVRALGAAMDPQEIAGLVAGPLMHRYSKAPEYAYDTALRQQVLASAEREHGTQIRRGMRWLETFAAHPVVDRVLSVRSKATE
ncbi:MAG TPA: hypothetical protein VHV80_02355 [Steroidobacteraceae bacterium]|nr:hypothetical protein [Steroidobacteraceae bacterium]